MRVVYKFKRKERTKSVTGQNRPVSYTHPDAADERSSVDLGGRRIIKKKKQEDILVMSSVEKQKRTTDNTKYRMRRPKQEA